MRVKTPNGDGGSKMFVNISSHEALDQPKDQFGRPVQPGEQRNAEGLTMPLLVGKPRPCADHSGETKAMALDVVFHPWVIERCDLDNTFKAQVIELALNWIEQEVGTRGTSCLLPLPPLPPAGQSLAPQSLGAQSRPYRFRRRPITSCFGGGRPSGPSTRAARERTRTNP